jgi:hypothetical protein
MIVLNGYEIEALRCNIANLLNIQASDVTFIYKDNEKTK